MYRLLIICFVLVGCQSYIPKNTASVNVEGRWDWSSSENHCGSSWHKIKIDSERNRLVFENSKSYEQYTGEITPFYEYEIISLVPGGYHLTLEAEQRKDKNGKIITWYLLFEGEGMYKWRRSDWSETSRTKAVKRCR